MYVSCGQPYDPQTGIDRPMPCEVMAFKNHHCCISVHDVEVGLDIAINFRGAAALRDWSDRLAAQVKKLMAEEEAKRVADPSYVPTVEEAARNPAAFVDGMEEVGL